MRPSSPIASRLFLHPSCVSARSVPDMTCNPLLGLIQSAVDGSMLSCLSGWSAFSRQRAEQRTCVSVSVSQGPSSGDYSHTVSAAFPPWSGCPPRRETSREGCRWDQGILAKTVCLISLPASLSTARHRRLASRLSVAAPCWRRMRGGARLRYRQQSIPAATARHGLSTQSLIQDDPAGCHQVGYVPSGQSCMISE